MKMTSFWNVVLYRVSWKLIDVSDVPTATITGAIKSLIFLMMEAVNTCEILIIFWYTTQHMSQKAAFITAAMRT
jgi:hypothetical protein